MCTMLQSDLNCEASRLTRCSSQVQFGPQQQQAVNADSATNDQTNDRISTEMRSSEIHAEFLEAEKVGNLKLFCPNSSSSAEVALTALMDTMSKVALEIATRTSGSNTISTTFMIFMSVNCNISCDSRDKPASRKQQGFIQHA